MFVSFLWCLFLVFWLWSIKDDVISWIAEEVSKQMQTKSFISGEKAT